MLRIRSLSALLLGVALSLCALGAQAQHAEPTDEELAQAREVFAEALELVEQERWSEAETRFRLVLEVRSSPVVSYNLASTLVHQGRLVDASEVLRGVVRDEEADQDSRDAAHQLLDEIEPRIGSLTVRLAGDTEGAELLIDDRPVEIGGVVQAVSVDPGTHVVALKRRGELVSTEHVEVGGASPLHVEVRMELPEPADLRVAERAAQLDAQRELEIVSLPPEPRAEGGGILTEWWFWAGAGVLVAGGVATAVALAGGGTADPVSGDTEPPLIRGRVRMEMP